MTAFGAGLKGRYNNSELLVALGMADHIVGMPVV